MKTLKTFALSFALSFALWCAMPLAALLAGNALAQTTSDPGKVGSAKTDPAAAASDMSDGEVRKIDKDNMKITLKHGDIKNLDMPGMTMVFQVKDAALLDKLQVGGKVRFKAVKEDGKFMVTDIQPAP